MTVEELIKKLETLPQDADVFVSNLCMGWLDGRQVRYDEEPGYKVTNATFKETEVWYFVEPMDSEYVPKQKKFIEKSMYGIAEGVIIFNESR